MNTYMHKTMVSVVSLEKIETIRSQEFMPREVRLKLKKKKIILGPKTAILGPQFCRILVLGPHFRWSGGAWAPLDPPLNNGLSRACTITCPITTTQYLYSTSNHGTVGILLPFGVKKLNICVICGFKNTFDVTEVLRVFIHFTHGLRLIYFPLYRNT